MNHSAMPQRKTIVVLLLAVLAAAMYLISTKYAYDIFQETRLVDPLAQLHSLPVFYYIAIAMVAAAALICLITRIQNRGMHLFILTLLAVMLWYTPYYLAGFLKMPGNLWHVGVAMHMPEVLAGQPITASYYAEGFPGSYIFHHLFINTLGIEPVIYIHLFPLFSLCLFVLLCYIFVSRLFNPGVALLSLMLAIPGLHYFELHPSPHVLGLLLMMTVLVLLLKPRLSAGIMAMALIAIFAIIASHPITPLLLCVFLGAGVVTICLYQRSLGKAQAASVILLAFCFAGWFLWPTLQLASPPTTVAEPPTTVVTPYSRPSVTVQASAVWEEVVPEGLESTRQLLGGATFIYSGINNLRQGIYFLYGLLAVSAILYVIVRNYRAKAKLKEWITGFGGLNQNEVFMTLSALLFLILTVLLIERHTGLTERSLTFLIFTLCCVVASIAARHFFGNVRTKAIAWASAAVVFLFLVISFPAGAYSQDAYTSIPAAEESGLKFLAANEAVDEKTISMRGLGGLAFYSPYSNPTRPDSGKPDLRVFRSTAYYVAAMRQDLSFEDNRFTRLLNEVEADSEYDKVYSNPAFQVYLSSN